MTKSESSSRIFVARPFVIRHSTFVIPSSLGIGNSSFPFRDLLEIQLNDPRVVVAVLRLHVLQDLGAKFAGEFAPRFAGVLLQFLRQHASVRGALRNAGARRRLTVG